MYDSTCFYSFLLLRAWSGLFHDLPDDQAGILIKAIFDYADGVETVPDNPELRRIYNMIVKDINLRSKRYEEKKNKNKAG